MSAAVVSPGLCLSFVFVLVVGLVFCFVFVLVLIGLLFVLGLLFVAFGRQWRLLVLAKHRNVDAARDAMLVARHVETRGRQRDIGRSSEVEILAVLIPYRIEGVAHAVGDLERFALLEGVDEDRMQSAGKLTDVRDPLVVGRPGLADGVGREGPVIVGVDEFRRGIVEVEVPQLQALIDVGDLLAVRRPSWRVEERWWIAEIDATDIAKSILVANGQFVFAGLIGEVGDGLSIGRPRGIAIGYSRTVREIANVSLISGDSEDLTPGFKDSASAGRRDAEVLYTFRLDLGKVWTHRL